MQSLLLAASDLADTPTTFPGLFTLYTFLFALTVLYYLLLSPNFRAFAIGGPLQKLLKWALGEDQQLKISGIGFALLSGKIYLNHVEYRTKNSCIRVLQVSSQHSAQLRGPALRSQHDRTRVHSLTASMLRSPPVHRAHQLVV